MNETWYTVHFNLSTGEIYHKEINPWLLDLRVNQLFWDTRSAFVYAKNINRGTKRLKERVKDHFEKEVAKAQRILNLIEP